MFDKLFKVKHFDKLCPELLPYIKEEDERKALANNDEFITKYKKNYTIISTFIFEINKYYKNFEVISIIKKYIIKLEDKQLVDFILIYLNLSDESKMDSKFFAIYDKKHGLEEKTEEQINKEREIDFQYNRVKNGTENFNELSLDSLYETCDYPERELINDILGHQGWGAFKFIFEGRYHASFKQLMILLNKSLIDGEILNKQVQSNLGDKLFEELIFTLLSNQKHEIAKYIKTLIRNDRHDLIVHLIKENLIGDEVFIETINQENLNDKEFIDKLDSIKVKLLTNN